MRISDWSSDGCSSDLRDDVDRVVDHDEAGGAQAASNRGQALPAERDVEEVGGEEGVGGAGENGDDLLASGWAAERRDDLAQRGAQLELSDPGPLCAAGDRADHRPWRLGRAERAELLGSVEPDVRQVGERLDVVHEGCEIGEASCRERVFQYV